MNFEVFMKLLEEARDFSRIENAYSHIIIDTECPPKEDKKG